MRATGNRHQITRAAVLAALALAAASPARAADTPLAIADLGNANVAGVGAGAVCSSFNPEAPGRWGGEFGEGAVTAFPGDPDPAAYCRFEWHDHGWLGRRIEMRVLDGIGEDEFQVFVKTPAGKWVRVYQYTGRYATETWVVHRFELPTSDKGQSSPLELKIIPGIIEWPGYPIWGSLAVDYVAVYEAGSAPRPGAAIGHLYLHAKDADWQVVSKGAWGKLQYRRAGSEFTYAFNAHRLAPGTDYTLIYYADPWVAAKTCLGSGRSNEYGDLHLIESPDTGDLPAPYDTNYPGGAKIWLVLSKHVDCNAGRMTAWTPAAYVFEGALVTFDDLDD